MLLTESNWTFVSFAIQQHSYFERGLVTDRALNRSFNRVFA